MIYARKQHCHGIFVVFFFLSHIDVVVVVVRVVTTINYVIFTLFELLAK